MRILFVTHFFPYPPTCGGRIGYYNPIKYLSRQHEIVLVSMVGEPNPASIEEMKKMCAGVHVFRCPSWRQRTKLLKGMVSQPPGSAAKFFDVRFGKLIKDCVEHYKVDLVELQHLNTAAYLPYVSNVPAILREHNIEYKVWERHAQYAPRASERLYVRWCAGRVRAYEAQIAASFARCVTVSEADANYLNAIAPTARVDTIPSGVDTEYFMPADVPEDPCSMVMTGSFDWLPKQHNLRVLLTQIFPAIRSKLPNAKLTLVGSGMPAELRKLGDNTPGVVITGAVADVRDYVRRSALVLNYVESGGGIALKVLEAMAMRKPVLSNRLGCEGIAVQHGRDVFLADGTPEFAETAALLLRDASTRNSIASGGYNLVHTSYSWNRLSGSFEDCYRAVLAEARSSVVATPLAV